MGGDFAGDFAQIVHCFAYVLADEVAADAVGESLYGALQGLLGSCECLVVAGVGHYHLAFVGFGQCGCFDEHVLQLGECGLLFCRDEDVLCVGRQQLCEGVGDGLPLLVVQAVVFVYHGYELLAGGVWQYLGAELCKVLGWVCAVDEP